MRAQPRILLLGADGQVGWELRRTLAALGVVRAATRNGALPVDLADLDGLLRTLDAERPDLVVNAAAYTAVDQAEAEPALAHRVNAEAPGLIGEWAARSGALVVHYSTDYVFDGRKAGPYVEDDAPAPLSVYGRTKLAGDEALLGSAADALILRVAWVYGLRGRNFLRTMQRLMVERAHLRVVDDQIGAPTWSRLIAEATALVLGKLLAGAPEAGAVRGVYHLSPTGSTSWHGFADAIRLLGGYGCQIEPIPTAEYPTPAARPANSRLDAGKLRETFSIALPDWRECLELCLGE